MVKNTAQNSQGTAAQTLYEITNWAHMLKLKETLCN
jgi:hypothetical protein